MLSMSSPHTEPICHFSMGPRLRGDDVRAVLVNVTVPQFDTPVPNFPRRTLPNPISPIMGRFPARTAPLPAAALPPNKNDSDPD
jgi:hypothetical protein